MIFMLGSAQKNSKMNIGKCKKYQQYLVRIQPNFAAVVQTLLALW